MAAVDTPGPSGGRKKKGFGGKRPKRRVAIRIDMTPMVDVAFLLLIFFMVTTVFRQPQALEISLPPKEATVPVAESNIMTLRVLPGNVGDPKQAPPRVYYAIGTTPYALSPNIKSLGKTAADATKANPKLVVLIKIARDARYDSMVKIIDELELRKITRFGLAPLEDKDRAEVEAIR